MQCIYKRDGNNKEHDSEKHDMFFLICHVRFSNHAWFKTVKVKDSAGSYDNGDEVREEEEEPSERYTKTAGAQTESGNAQMRDYRRCYSNARDCPLHVFVTI